MSFPIALVLTASAWAQLAPESPPPEPSPEAAAARKTALEQFAKVAEAYRITMHDSRPVQLELSAAPILNWTGSAFVWLKDGRPEAIGSFWTDFYPRSERVRWHHAFHSLSDHPLTAEYDSKLVWSPKQAGVVFQPFKDAEPPAARPRERLTQMRALAREFSVVQTSEGKTRLRLLTQPIVRYEPTAGFVKDGAIFAFTHPTSGTDPDALLVLEAREVEAGLRWEFAFARFHFKETAGFLGDKEVWRVESEATEMRRTVFGTGQGRDKIYYSVAPP